MAKVALKDEMRNSDRIEEDIGESACAAAIRKGVLISHGRRRMQGETINGTAEKSP